jgi:hypothetical protein
MSNSQSCELCGNPGQLRHYPGAVPYTGVWCNACFENLLNQKEEKKYGLAYYNTNTGEEIMDEDVSFNNVHSKLIALSSPGESLILQMPNNKGIDFQINEDLSFNVDYFDYSNEIKLSTTVNKSTVEIILQEFFKETDIRNVLRQFNLKWIE